MICVKQFGAHVFTSAYLLFVTGCIAQKVYFDCGAKVDMVDAQGLILSPGFPYNYSSGTHCVWQFVVPMDCKLILEIFDFDVFKSYDSVTPFPTLSNFDDQEADEEVTLTPSSQAAKQTSSEIKDAMFQSQGDGSKTQQYLEEIKIKQVLVQEQSTKKETTKVSNSAKTFADALTGQSSPPLPPFLFLHGAVPPEKKVENTTFTSQWTLGFKPGSDPSRNTKGTTTASPLSTSPTSSLSAGSEVQGAVLDDCPHDVLYISDLITFSSRFCGTSRPPSSQMIFGSSQEMVEVILELITTTHWGRGFALLFHYHNLTESGVGRLVSAPTASKVDTMLAAMSGAAFFAMILTSALCIIFRLKLCPKRASSPSSDNAEALNLSPPDCSVEDNRRNFSDIHLETKADTSSISDSPISNASCPLPQDAQRCSRFTMPCFGLLTGMPDATKSSGVIVGSGYPLELDIVQHAGNQQYFPNKGDHITVPLFGISENEKEDQQPLVSAEHLNQSCISAVLNRLATMAHDDKRPAAVESTNLSSRRVRPEWRLWGSQVLAGIGPFPSSESNVITGQPSSLTPSPV